MTVDAQAEKERNSLRHDLDELDKIIRGSNGDGLTTRLKVLETEILAMTAKVDSIYRLLWGGIIALVLERVAERIF